MKKRYLTLITLMLIPLFLNTNKCKKSFSTHIEEYPDYFLIYNIDDSYYINKSNGLGFGNSVNYSWNKYEICLDILYKNNWYNNTCIDTIPLTWSYYQEPNYTYVELNGTYELSNSFRIVFSYYLHDYIDFNKLKISIYITSLNNRYRIQDSYVYFITKDIKINNSYQDNALVLNTTYKEYDIYDLHNLNLQYSMSELRDKKFELWKRDYNSFSQIFAEFRWYDDYQYWLIVSNSSGEYNSRVILKQKTGEIQSRTTKIIHYSWRDPDISYYPCGYSGTCSCTGYLIFCWDPYTCCNLNNCNVFCQNLNNAQVVYNSCEKSCSGCSRSCSQCSM